MNKGIVMEINNSNIVVMSSSGRFDKLPRAGRACEVGEEILYADAIAPRRKVPPLAIVSGLVAAVVFCFVLISGLQATTANAEVVAYVSIDINPSVEIGIDSQEIVRDLRGVNADGIELIATLEYKGKNLEEVTAAILDKAEQGTLAKGEGDIVISSSLVGNKATLNDEEIANKLRLQVAKHIQSAHPAQVNNYEVTAFAVPVEVRDEAKISGVTAGKYAVYLNALNTGTQITIEDIQDKSIHQLAKDNGGMNNLVDPAKPITKSALKELLDEKKSGKLTEKAEDKDKNNNTNSNNNKSNDKSSSKSNQVDNKNVNNNQTSTPASTTNKNNNKNETSQNNNNKNGNKNDDKNKDDKNNDKNKDDKNKSDNRDDIKNNDQKGGASSNKPGASLSPSPSRTPVPTKKPAPTLQPRNWNDPRSGEDNKNKQDNKRQEDNRRGDSNNRND